MDIFNHLRFSRFDILKYELTAVNKHKTQTFLQGAGLNQPLCAFVLSGLNLPANKVLLRTAHDSQTQYDRSGQRER